MLERIGLELAILESQKVERLAELILIGQDLAIGALVITGLLGGNIWKRNLNVLVVILILLVYGLDENR